MVGKCTPEFLIYHRHIEDDSVFLFISRPQTENLREKVIPMDTDMISGLNISCLTQIKIMLMEKSKAKKATCGQ